MTRIALCQLTTGTDPAGNVELIRQRVVDAAAQGAKAVVFPEATMARFGTPLAPVAEPLDGPWAAEVRSIADEYGVLVVAGMFTPASGGRVHNTVLLTGLGQHAGYDKIHLYDAFGFRESDTVAGGADLLTVRVEDAVLGIATCYDLRFPELFQALARSGAAAMLVPASWGAGTGKRAQWELLTRARALDSGSWVLACGQADPAETGAEVHPKAPTGIGYSMVADPFGGVHAQLGPAPELLITDIDPAAAERSRAATAVLANQRIDASGRQIRH